VVSTSYAVLETLYEVLSCSDELFVVLQRAIFLLNTALL
jgi:hypothetical protein